MQRRQHAGNPAMMRALKYRRLRAHRSRRNPAARHQSNSAHAAARQPHQDAASAVALTRKVLRCKRIRAPSAASSLATTEEVGGDLAGIVFLMLDKIGQLLILRNISLYFYQGENRHIPMPLAEESVNGEASLGQPADYSKPTQLMGTKLPDGSVIAVFCCRPQYVESEPRGTCLSNRRLTPLLPMFRFLAFYRR